MSDVRRQTWTARGRAAARCIAPLVIARLVVVLSVIVVSATVLPSAAQTPPATPAPSAGPTSPPQPTGPSQADLDLLRALQAGGHAIIMRHATADPDKFDSDPRNFRNVRNQQPLTEAGQAAARAFGESLRATHIPIGEVLTSRFNRAHQTAVLAGFKDAKAVAELTEGSLVTSPNEQRRRSIALKQLAAAPLPRGTNRLLVTHRVNIMQAFGKEWFDVKEGEASVFRIENGAYSLIARLQISDWARLAAIPR